MVLWACYPNDNQNGRGSQTSDLFFMFRVSTKSSAMKFMQAIDFYGYFSSIKDEVEKVLDSGAKYKGLSWKMTSKKPARTP